MVDISLTTGGAFKVTEDSTVIGIFNDANFYGEGSAVVIEKNDGHVLYRIQLTNLTVSGVAVSGLEDAAEKLIAIGLGFSIGGGSGSGASGESGYSHTGAFAGKPLSNNYVWEPGEGINYTAEDVANETYKLFSLDRAVHLAVDQPYWTDPAPGDPTDIGLFAGQNLPSGVTSLFDFSYNYDTENSSITHQYYALNNGTETGYEGTIGRIKLNECVPGDLLKVRFEFDVTPQIANTTVEPALWYSNRNASDEITFTFALETSPTFFGTGSVGKAFHQRVEISAWITSTEDVNALILPALRADNPVIIQPIGMLVQIIR